MQRETRQVLPLAAMIGHVTLSQFAAETEIVVKLIVTLYLTAYPVAVFYIGPKRPP